MTTDRSRNPKRRASLGWLLVAVMATAAACSGSGALDELRADPMAQVTLPGASLDRRIESAGSTSPKSAPAEVLLRFEPTNTDLESVVRAAVTAAAEAGWAMEDPLSTGTVFGTKQFERGQGRIAIRVVTDDAGVDLVSVGLSLRP